MEVKQMESEIASLLEEFKSNGICHDAKSKRFHMMLRFQDLIGHSTSETIWEIYEPMDQNARETFMWACFSTLSKDTAVQILKWTTIKHYKRLIQDEVLKFENERMEELNKRSRQLDNYEAYLRDHLRQEIEAEVRNRSWYWEKISKQKGLLFEAKEIIEGLTATNKELEKAVENLRVENDSLIDKAIDMDHLRISLKSVLKSS